MIVVFFIAPIDSKEKKQTRLSGPTYNWDPHENLLLLCMRQPV